MLPPGYERMCRLRHQGEKPVEDAIMDPNLFPVLVAAARAGEGVPWVLVGDLAASSYMESRASARVEMLVPHDQQKEEVQARLTPLPEGYSIEVHSAVEVGLDEDLVMKMHGRARNEDVAGCTVFIPKARDLFLVFLADDDVIMEGQTRYYCCRLHLLHGPWGFEDVDLTPHQCQRLGGVAAAIMNHVAGKLEDLAESLG